MKLLAAVIYMCVSGGQCEEHTIRVERSACGRHYQAQVPVNGEWRDAQAGVRCTVTWPAR